MFPKKNCGLVLLVILYSGPLSGAEMFGLQIEPEAGKATYDRDLYNHWIVADGDGLDTRQEALVSESLVPPIVNDDGGVKGGYGLTLFRAL